MSTTALHDLSKRLFNILIWPVLILLFFAFSGCDGSTNKGANTKLLTNGTSVQGAAATTLDTVVFGNSASEASHNLSTGFGPVQAIAAPMPSEPSSGNASDVITGGLGQTARRLLPRTPNADYYGGEMSFTMNVDPVQENNFTIKVYGSETSSSWLVLNVNGYEVGWRHSYQMHDEQMLLDHSGWFPNRFFYRTVRLPWHLTKGQTSVTIKLRSLGYFAAYAPGSYDNRQQRMKEATVGVYSAYTHTGNYLDISSEAQGTAPAAKTPRTDITDLNAYMDWWKSGVNTRVSNLLSADASTVALPYKVLFLAQAYGRTWSNAYQNPAVIDKSIAAIDAMVTGYSADPSGYATSGGGCNQFGNNFGEVGEALSQMWNASNATTWDNAMNATVNYGGTIGSSTRRNAWSKALRASLDKSRYNRLGIVSQQLIIGWCIYTNNRGLQLVDKANSLSEPEALRYVYEAVGISPWLGNDKAGGGNTPVRGDPPFGPNWYTVTSKGTGRDDCLSGGDYGEIGAFIFRMGMFTGDAQIKAQALKILRARAGLRHPELDSQGYLASYAVEPIGCRNPHEMNSHIVYIGRGGYEDMLIGAQGASVIGTDLLGYLQQQFNEGQLSWLLWYASYPDPNNFNYGNSVGAPLVPDYYAAFSSQAATAVKLPMSTGQPDFAWTDEENMVVAAKHGEERFWAVLNWHDADAINRLAKVFTLSDTTSRIADVSVDDVQYTPTGGKVLRNGDVQPDAPPDKPINANNGLRLPTAMRPDLSSVPPSNRDAGRASAYTLRYGHWLVGMNAHPSETYTMPLPTGFNGGTDLVSGTNYGTTVTIAPKTTVVFYLSSDVSMLTPASPLLQSSVGGNQTVLLSWDSAPGATSYVIERATSKAGPYSTVASGITSTTYSDGTVTNGTNYYYRISSVGPSGARSPAAPVSSSTPIGSSLPAPWMDKDIGAVSVTGTASYSNGVYTVAGSGADIWSTVDAFHFAAQPMANNGTITARVASQMNTDGWSRVGVMLRDDLSPSSRHVMVLLTASNGAQMIYRNYAGGGTTAMTLTGISAPYWVRLTRAGNTITGYISPDGNNWKQVGTISMELSDAVYAGLAVNSVKSGVLNTSTFDNVSLSSP